MLQNCPNCSTPLAPPVMVQEEKSEAPV
jgi:hypothetical protein